MGYLREIIPKRITSPCTCSCANPVDKSSVRTGYFFKQFASRSYCFDLIRIDHRYFKTATSKR